VDGDVAGRLRRSVGQLLNLVGMYCFAGVVMAQSLSIIHVEDSPVLSGKSLKAADEAIN
jgi:hypothetical protein